MKIFFYTGLESDNKSGVAWKIWKIERHGRKLQVWWAPAKAFRTTIAPTARFQTKSWSFRTEAEAREDELTRIQEQLNQGYKRKPRTKSS